MRCETKQNNQLSKIHQANEPKLLINYRQCGNCDDNCGESDNDSCHDDGDGDGDGDGGGDGDGDDEDDEDDTLLN